MSSGREERRLSNVERASRRRPHSLAERTTYALRRYLRITLDITSRDRTVPAEEHTNAAAEGSPSPLAGPRDTCQQCDQLEVLMELMSAELTSNHVASAALRQRSFVPLESSRPSRTLLQPRPLEACKHPSFSHKLAQRERAESTTLSSRDSRVPLVRSTAAPDPPGRACAGRLSG